MDQALEPRGGALTALHHPIYLFRHGETVWNAEKRAQGHLDSPLTAAGRAQARAMGLALGQELARAGYEPPTVVVRASPLGRVRETLALAAEAAGLVHDDACHDHRLREVSWGDWDGLNGAEIEARWPGQMAARRLDAGTTCPPNGENYVMASDARAGCARRHRGAGGRQAGRGVRPRRDRPGAARPVPRRAAGRHPEMDQPQDAFYRLHRGAAERIG